MDNTELFERLWNDYSQRTPSAQKVKDLFESEGNVVANDHIAFRTFDDDRVNIDVLAMAFLEIGYEFKADYHFEKKKLYAKHFEHKTDKHAPLIFISQLITDKFSFELRQAITSILDSVDFSTINPESLIFSGRLWEKPSYETYGKLLKESEYAAWLYVNGFCPNHFTVDVNKLNSFNNLQEINTFLKVNGFKMNASGGEIKGAPNQFLEQSSILADKINFKFQEGIFDITSCYYEFAYRYDNNGSLFRGFIADSADKIFESTDMVLQ